MKQKEILERLRCGADVAHAEDVHLHVGPEVCKAAADLIESLGRTNAFGWQPDQGGIVGQGAAPHAAQAPVITGQVWPTKKPE